MTIDLEDRAAYAQLGVSADAELLVYDVFTMRPSVPENLLARVGVNATSAGDPSRRIAMRDPNVDALVYVPDDPRVSAEPAPLRLELRVDLARDEPILALDIER